MNRSLVVLCALLAVVVALAFWQPWHSFIVPVAEPAVPASHEGVTLVDLQTAIAEQRFDEAVRVVEQLKQHADKLDFPSGHRGAALFQAGNVLAQQGRLTAAAWCLRQAVRGAPAYSPYRLRLAMLLYVCGDYPQALSHWNVLLQHGGLDLISLPLLGNRELRWAYEDRSLEQGYQADPQDPLVLMGLAHRSFQEKDFVASEKFLREILRLKPDLLEAQVRLSQLLFESGRHAELARWLGQLDPRAVSHPEIWLIRGHLSRQADDNAGAARCYWEAYQRDPNHLVASENLVQSLFAIEQPMEAERLAARSELLRKYEVICRVIHLNNNVALGNLRSAAAYSEQVGCIRDALAWSGAALAVNGQEPWALAMQRRLQNKVPAGDQRSSPADDLRNRIDLSTVPVPPLPKVLEPAVPPASASDSSNQAVQDAENIQFADSTASAGIDFVFADGADPTTEETVLFEFTGGGVGVIDYDLDNRPDIFFVQGGAPPSLGSPASLEKDSPADANPSRPSDQLYRNLGDGSFARLTDPAGVADAQYGQGVSVGDYNADGFADLYVANIGANALYRNNGDGTFSLVDSPAIAAQQSWTTSCVVADINGDGLADIYDVCYVPNQLIHLRMCRSGVASVPCDRSQPMLAGQDRLLLNSGNGQFEDITDSSGIVADEGIGLGIVAADFSGSGQLQLFIANDAKPNFLFVNQQAAGVKPQFDEQAVLRGLAYSGLGIPQAGMGVAADDMDNDGRVDLFVTNFYADYNTLYRQHAGGLFEDATHHAGLQSVSFHQLGFGTQFLDADLDGLSDLVLTNGDVVDFSDVTPGREYAQRSQFLKNMGAGRFDELRSETLGPYFEQANIGRGLARLDWNADGREDFVVSNIGTPSRLMTNTTVDTGHYVDVRLVGRQSNRDAIGTVITVTTDLRSWTKQMTAGDGYMASNQRCRVFGLGPSERIVDIEVRWPNGGVDRIAPQSAIDHTILIVEGLADSYILD